LDVIQIYAEPYLRDGPIFWPPSSQNLHLLIFCGVI